MLTDHFSKSGSNPPPLVRPTLHTRMVGQMDIQTDGDYTKRVVTPFGTTRLKNRDNRKEKAGKDQRRAKHAKEFLSEAKRNTVAKTEESSEYLMRNKNGWSAMNSIRGRAAFSLTITAVAAAASVPSSFT